MAAPAGGTTPGGGNGQRNGGAAPAETQRGTGSESVTIGQLRRRQVLARLHTAERDTAVTIVPGSSSQEKQPRQLEKQAVEMTLQQIKECSFQQSEFPLGVQYRITLPNDAYLPYQSCICEQIQCRYDSCIGNVSSTLQMVFVLNCDRPR